MSTSSMKRRIGMFHVVVVHSWTSKKCTKKRDARTVISSFAHKTICFMTLLLLSSSLLKVSDIWRSVPTHTVTALQELYQQMSPTKLYPRRKTGKGNGTSNVMCRLCVKSPESRPHVLAGCGTLAKTISISRGIS